MKPTLAQCAEWMNGNLYAPSETPAQRYPIDTPTLAPGELFFAVSDDRFDAHGFVQQALLQGAAAAVVARDKVAKEEFASLRNAPRIEVDDPLLALQRLGTAVRSHWPGTLIGLTGSAGKTTTKEMIAAVLAAKHTVLKSAGNLNNHFGVPLQLLRLELEHSYAVIEMGMSNAGEIALLARLAAPDWGVVTNVGMAHAQNFADGIEGIARAKRELIDALRPADGIAFLNADDQRVTAFAETFAGRVVRTGVEADADVRAIRVEEQGTAGLSLEVSARGEHATVRLHFMGAHNASNALLALAVGLEAGVSLETGAAALAQVVPGDKRGELLQLVVTGEHAGTARLINDCYNSNPAALSAMIDTLMQLPARRHIVVAGEMLELGPETGPLHAACGARAAKAGADWVIGVQGAALALAEEAARFGIPSLFLHNAEEAGAWLQRELRGGDAVLVKGSRGVRLERAITVLLAGAPAGDPLNLG